MTDKVWSKALAPNSKVPPKLEPGDEFVFIDHDTMKNAMILGSDGIMSGALAGTFAFSFDTVDLVHGETIRMKVIATHRNGAITCTVVSKWPTRKAA